MTPEIWVIPFFGQGHLLPSMELCKLIASRNLKTTLIISSDLSSSIPSSFSQYPLLQVAQLPSSPPPPPPPPQPSSDPFQHHINHHSQMAQAIENLISIRSQNPDSGLLICAVVDVMMSWTGQIFNNFEIPTVGFFTSGACSAAMEYAMWKNHPEDLKTGEIRLLPGLPDDMALTELDLKTRPHRPPSPSPSAMGGAPLRPPGAPGGFPIPPGGIGPRKFGPPKPGDQPPWLEETQGSIALMINTCNILELPFMEYLANQIGKPVWGVGPLLPDQYWKSAGSIIHDHQFRANRRSNFTEDEVITWLDSKPRGSVLYVSFGTEVGPTIEEYQQIAHALEKSNRSFIWAIQLSSGRRGPPRPAGQAEAEECYFPHGLDERVGERGLIIHGWAPQLLILSHPSTGGFLSHCGWNSTTEAIGRGMPILAWPIRGDQFYNAQLIVKHLKVGYMICDDMSTMVKADVIVNGMERLLGDEEVKKRAAFLGAQFQNGFPLSSIDSLDAFSVFINHKTYLV
ncbi:hypothetical protein P3X46_000429 [Hevea brasiliensis]|uniref:Glycosyltransferase n=1 Tax=Hevea brasiliensis TaxID=3981 RepID=A0ABQ9NCD2_HEVBR|nr:probable UDP-glucosyl transferase 73B6 [Hevea brasiliensis]KAJ9189098.1 hypothetical protein P3X46_000429 [Hevea brasiliensis]